MHYAQNISAAAPGFLHEREGRRASALARGLLLASIVLLPIDAFPLGMQFLREFGARPTNFVLLIAAVFLAASYAVRWRSQRLDESVVWVLLLVGLGVPAINLPVAVYEAGGSSDAISAWFKQYLMLVWGVVSFGVWLCILRSVSEKDLSTAILTAAFISVGVFLVDYFGWADDLGAVLDWLRRRADIRPSGLASEPSLFSSWVGIFWSLALLVGLTAQGRIKRKLAWLAIAGIAACAYLSTARTIAVVAALQFGFVVYWVFGREGGLQKRLGSVLALVGIGGVCGILLLSRLLSAVDIADSASSLARFTYVLTGLSVVASHPFFGVGIGQFTSFFAEHVPALARGSIEIAQHLNGESEFRESTFNLLVRLMVEFGIPVGLVIGWWIVRPLRRAMGSRERDAVTLAGCLCAIGGMSFWLQQDQYGYQPAIFSLALLTTVLDRKRATPCLQ